MTLQDLVIVPVHAKVLKNPISVVAISVGTVLEASIITSQITGVVTTFGQKPLDAANQNDVSGSQDQCKQNC